MSERKKKGLGGWGKRFAWRCRCGKTIHRSKRRRAVTSRKIVCKKCGRTDWKLVRGQGPL